METKILRLRYDLETRVEIIEDACKALEKYLTEYYWDSQLKLLKTNKLKEEDIIFGDSKVNIFFKNREEWIRNEWDNFKEKFDAKYISNLLIDNGLYDIFMKRGRGDENISLDDDTNKKINEIIGFVKNITNNITYKQYLIIKNKEIYCGEKSRNEIQLELTKMFVNFLKDNKLTVRFYRKYKECFAYTFWHDVKLLELPEKIENDWRKSVEKCLNKNMFKYFRKQKIDKWYKEETIKDFGFHIYNINLGYRQSESFFLALMYKKNQDIALILHIWLKNIFEKVLYIYRDDFVKYKKMNKIKYEKNKG